MIGLTRRILIPAIALAFLGFAGVPGTATADHCKGRHKNDPGCDGGGGTSGLTFSVAITGDPDFTEGSSLWLPSCTGQTPESSGNSINAVVLMPVPGACAALTTSEGASLTDDIIVETDTNRDGDVTAMRLIGQDVVGADGIAHETDWVPIDPPAVPDATGFVIHLHGADIDLWKLDTHRVMKKSKRVEWVGTFSVGDLIYTPQ